MYEEHYGLKTDPFRLSPDHRFCLRHTTFEKAKAYMQFAVHRAEGFVMITGRPGTGKSTLIEDVLQELEGKEIVVAKLVTAQLGAQDLLQMTAFNFGIPTQGNSKATLIMEMQGFFANCIADGQRPLLVIDEAQGLSIDAMEELRLLTNLRINDLPMLQIFLVGQEELLDMVLDPRMEQLHQRLIASCHLEPLDFKQTAAYVMHRLKVADWNGKPKLRASIFRPLFSFSQGIPRRINLFMGRLLMHGWLEDKEVLTDIEANLVLEELKHEHLAPLRPGRPLTTTDLQMDVDDIAEELKVPAQKIGGKLMARAVSEQLAEEIQPPQPAPSAAQQQPTVISITKHTEAGQEKSQPNSSHADTTSLDEVDDVTAQEHSGDEWHETTATISEHEKELIRGNMQSNSHGMSQNLWGLGFSLLTAALLLGLVLLISPMPSTSGASREAPTAISLLRGKLHHWSGGTLPLFFQADEPVEAIKIAENDSIKPMAVDTKDSIEPETVEEKKISETKN